MQRWPDEQQTEPTPAEPVPTEQPEPGSEPAPDTDPSEEPADT